ncbi:MAG TPA: SAM-dependent methyltransferase, partial [Blastocatellia bacterium]
RIIARIRSAGPITFHDFMRAALYDEESGYYNTERAKIGPGGDYYTSSNVHPSFGRVIARQIIDLWDESAQAGVRGQGSVVSRQMIDLWDESTLTLVEMGAGTGRLAEDILRSFREDHPATFERLNYLIVETSPAMRRLQRERLKGFGQRVSWRSLEEIARNPVAGIFFSNELIDAMPVHRVRRAAQAAGLRVHCLEEQYVTLDHSQTEPRLALGWSKLSSEKLARYIERCGANLKAGWIAEINLDAIDWLAQVSKALERGYLITIDYGDVATHLFSQDRRDGTLRSFHRHRLVDSPLEKVGLQDITSSVNFTALIEYGRDCGFETISYERQSAFLLRNGLIDIVASMEAATGSIDDMKERLAIKNLFLPGGVSDNFRVLVQRKPMLDRIDGKC